MGFYLYLRYLIKPPAVPQDLEVRISLAIVHQNKAYICYPNYAAAIRILTDREEKVKRHDCHVTRKMQALFKHILSYSQYA